MGPPRFGATRTWGHGGLGSPKSGDTEGWGHQGLGPHSDPPAGFIPVSPPQGRVPGGPPREVRVTQWGWTCRGPVRAHVLCGGGTGDRAFWGVPASGARSWRPPGGSGGAGCGGSPPAWWGEQGDSVWVLPKISLTASTGCPQPPAGDPNLGRAGLLHPKTWGGFGVPSLEASSTRGGERPPQNPGVC